MLFSKYSIRFKLEEHFRMLVFSHRIGYVAFLLVGCHFSRIRYDCTEMFFLFQMTPPTILK